MPRTAPKLCGIYTITCAANGMVYVGQSTNIIGRFDQHKAHLKTGVHKNPILQRCYDKYGVSNFVFAIDRECVDSYLDAEEAAKIAELRLLIGRSLVNYGEDVRNPMKGRKHSDEARIKMSAAGLGRKRPPRTPEWSQKISEAKTGKSQSAEHIMKSANARRGLTRSPEAIAKAAAKNRGQKRSDQTKALWSFQRTGRRLTQEWKNNISAALCARHAES